MLTPFTPSGSLPTVSIIRRWLAEVVRHMTETALAIVLALIVALIGLGLLLLKVDRGDVVASGAGFSIKGAWASSSWSWGSAAQGIYSITRQIPINVYSSARRPHPRRHRHHHHHHLGNSTSLTK
jgi:hypothetical protein